MAKPQCIQNTTARIVLDIQHPCPTEQLLYHLHWLPIHFCINYKIATLSYKVLALNQTLYVSHLLTPYTPAHTLRLQGKHLLTVPAVSTVIDRRAFSYAAPSMWNKIP